MPTNECPSCSSDLRGEPIPDRFFVHADNHDAQVAQSGRCFCLPYGERAPEDRFYSRKIGNEIPGVYDGTLFYSCPDCSARWQRFEEGHRLHAVAARYLTNNSTWA